MIRAKVNDKQQFDIEIEDNQVKINDQSAALDAIELSDGSLNLIHKGKSWNVRILSADSETKTYRLRINGQTMEVGLSDDMDLLLNRLGFSGMGSKKVNELKAPMPGLVLKVLVEPGQAVKKGDPLLVLEAMKMENILKSPGEAKVKAIKVSAQDKVEKNVVLIEFE